MDIGDMEWVSLCLSTVGRGVSPHFGEVHSWEKESTVDQDRVGWAANSPGLGECEHWADR